MTSIEVILKRLLDRLLPNREAPALGRVMKAHEGPGKNKYSVDVRVVTAGTLEETGRIIAEVPLSPVWVGASGRGLYAIPPEDTLVIVEFIAWNPAYPYIAGIYSDEYNAGEFKKGQFIITDGEGLKFGVDVDALFFFETRAQSLKKILDNIIDTAAKITTIGGPPSHKVSPASIQELTAIKQDINQLLKR
ncbi:MAG: hypothetical protein LBK83_07635 [Treponema sp.]|jgi:hypothetical protein|nr:hypothetical protein [Treponema sp.]